MGVGVMAKGWNSLGWTKIGLTVVSWVTSPLLGMLVAGGLYTLIKKGIMDHETPEKRAAQFRPILIGVTAGVMTLFICIKGPNAIRLPIGLAFVTAIAIGIGVGGIVTLVVRVVGDRDMEALEAGLQLQGSQPKSPSKDIEMPDLPAPSSPFKVHPPVMGATIFSVDDEPSNGVGLPLVPLDPTDRDALDLEKEPLPMYLSAALKPLIRVRPVQGQMWEPRPVVKAKADSGKPKRRGSKDKKKEETSEGPVGCGPSCEGHTKTEDMPGLEVPAWDGQSDPKLLIQRLRYDLTNLRMRKGEGTETHDGAIQGEDALRAAGRTEDLDPSDPKAIRRARLERAERVFRPLLVLSAAIVAFGHGANDVANPIGPFAAVLEIYNKGEIRAKPEIPVWVLMLGATSFILGILMWGYKTIHTVGTKITSLTPSRSFATQIGAAMALLTASLLGMPVSTSHCLVGAVIGIGTAQRFMGKRGTINSRMIGNIVLTWGVTIPLAMGVACAIFAGLRAIYD